MPTAPYGGRRRRRPRRGQQCAQRFLQASTASWPSPHTAAAGHSLAQTAPPAGPVGSSARARAVLAEHRPHRLLRDLRVCETEGEDKPLHPSEQMLLFCCAGKSANICAKKTGVLHCPQKVTVSSIKPVWEKVEDKETRF